MLSDKDFFFAYNEELVNFLRYTKSIRYICVGRNIKSNDKFYQFHRTEELNRAVQEFANRQIS